MAENIKSNQNYNHKKWNSVFYWQYTELEGNTDEETLSKIFLGFSFAGIPVKYLFWITIISELQSDFQTVRVKICLIHMLMLLIQAVAFWCCAINLKYTGTVVCVIINISRIRE
eukprot:m.65081 g.65081  ORF g.65081 m.65081 type:complete len:114 (-) comp11705_c0_seq1:153-494(-)